MRYTEYDPDKANAILDGLGLEQRDRDGFRLRTDRRGVAGWSSAARGLWGGGIDTFGRFRLGLRMTPPVPRSQ